MNDKNEEIAVLEATREKAIVKTDTLGNYSVTGSSETE